MEVFNILSAIGLGGVLLLGGKVWSLAYKLSGMEKDIYSNKENITKCEIKNDKLDSIVIDMDKKLEKIITILEEKEKHENDRRVGDEKLTNN